MFFAFILIFKVVSCDFQMGPFQEDTKYNTYCMITYENMGPKMCARTCMRTKFCTGINHKFEPVPTCELCDMSLVGGGLKLVTEVGTRFYDITTWTPESGPCGPNPCKGKQTCVITVTGNAYCLDNDIFHPTDCGDYRIFGNFAGMFTIYTDDDKRIYVNCFIEWTYILRRWSDSVAVTFSGHSWQDYKLGIKKVYDLEFWFGNENIHQLTKNNEYKLKVEISRDSTTRLVLEASYSTFKLNNESDRYRLTIGGYSGNAGDDGTTGMLFNNGHVFSTIDNDVTGIHDCPTTLDAGWWFDTTSTCTNVNLLGSGNMYWVGIDGLNGMYFIVLSMAKKNV